MKRPLFWTLLWTAVAATALAAQERQPGDDKGDKKAPGDQSQEILTRIAKNLATVEDRLKKVDPGDGTRKIQRDIIDDLNELIKQTNKSQSGGAGGKSKDTKPTDSKSGAQDKGGQNNKKSGDNPDKQGAKNDKDDDQRGQVKPGKGDQAEAKGKDKGQNKDSDNQEGTAKAGGKDQDNKGQVKADGPKGKENQVAAGGGAKQDMPPDAKRNFIADLQRDAWGHLPDKMRLEMDAYSKERFMPRYEDLLQQYYRTIAEQASGKEK